MSGNTIISVLMNFYFILQMFEFASTLLTIESLYGCFEIQVFCMYINWFNLKHMHHSGFMGHPVIVSSINTKQIT